jgi:hypothetical protein
MPVPSLHSMRVPSSSQNYPRVIVRRCFCHPHHSELPNAAHRLIVADARRLTGQHTTRPHNDATIVVICGRFRDVICLKLGRRRSVRVRCTCPP